MFPFFDFLKSFKFFNKHIRSTKKIDRLTTPVVRAPRKNVRIPSTASNSTEQPKKKRGRPQKDPVATELDGLQPDQWNDEIMVKITACDTNPELILAKPLRFFKISEITSSFNIGIIFIFTNCLLLPLEFYIVLKR